MGCSACLIPAFISLPELNGIGAAPGMGCILGMGAMPFSALIFLGTGATGIGELPFIPGINPMPLGLNDVGAADASMGLGACAWCRGTDICSEMTFAISSSNAGWLGMVGRKLPPAEIGLELMVAARSGA